MRNKFFFLLSLLLLLQACATGARKDQTNPVGPNSNGGPAPGPTEVYGPPAPEQTQTYGPDPIQIRPIALVLGPGLARGFAYVGVLKALIDSKIPIGAIYMTEMGSLVGTLYAVSANVNQFEWGLQKFKPDVFKRNSGFLARLNDQPSEGKEFEAQLQSVFGKKDLVDTKIPVRIGIQAKDTGAFMILDHGSIVQAVRSAVAAPGLFTPGIWPKREGGVEAMSAASVRPFLVNEAKQAQVGPVVVIDVLSHSESAIALDELRDADLVIRPDTTGIDYLDFQKKTESAYRGKVAVNHNIADLKRLVGMSENDSEKRSTQP